MEWSEIWGLISPYINTTAIVTAVGVVLKIVLGIRAEAKRTAQQLKNNMDVLATFKKALPSELVVSVEKLAGEEFSRMVEELQKTFIEPLEKMEESILAIARAVVCLKTVPEPIKQEILALMEENEKPQESEKIVLKINNEDEAEIEKKDEKPQPKVYVE